MKHVNNNKVKLNGRILRKRGLSRSVQTIGIDAMQRMQIIT